MAVAAAAAAIRRNARNQAKETVTARESDKLRRRVGDLAPKTEMQARYIQAILENDQVFGLGPAGTGKTYVATTIAADMLASGAVLRIVLCRPAVEVEEKHGFLPGDQGEKMAPWARPLIEVLEGRLGKAAFQKMIAAGRIEVLPFSYIRGLTLDGCFVILDEAQNTTPGQMKAFLTRIGEGTKVVIDGDITQVDLKGNVKSGLNEALRLVREFDIPAPIIEFTRHDIVHSGICRMWVDAFEGYRHVA